MNGFTFLWVLFGAFFLLTPVSATAPLSVACEKNFGLDYIDALHKASSTPLHAQGTTVNLLELFQDRRVDAIEAYGFQAEYFLKGASEELYWYPHFSALVVLAVREDCPCDVTGWADLRENVTIVLPDAAPEREIFFLALARGLSAKPHLADVFSLLAQLKQEHRLLFYPVRRDNQYQMAQADGVSGDVYVLFAHEAAHLVHHGAPLRICIPREGTLSFSKGLLSRRPLTFAASLHTDLKEAGYPIEQIPTASPVTDADAFLNEMTQANTLYRTEILARPAFMLREPHERVLLLVLTLVLTVFWGACLHRRVLHRGARRAVLLLIVMLLLWEMDRIVKILALPDDITLTHTLWYLYYVFRSGLSVALLWIAWASDEDVLNRRMPRWLRAVFGVNLFFAVLIMCNDFHYQFATFVWNADMLRWEERPAWGTYAYWVLWLLEIFAALLFLLKKAQHQKVLRPSIVLPFLLFAFFIFYSAVLHYDERFEWIELTCATVLFFLLLVEICLRTGLMPSNRFHEAFFSHSPLHMQLVDAAGRIIFASAAPAEIGAPHIRISRMEVDGGTIVWHEDLSRLHERQQQLALLRDALQRSHMLLRREHRIRKEHLTLTLKKQLSEELETILESKRPLLRHYRTQLMKITAPEKVTRLIRWLNLLSSYLKKRCVLFLKGQENGFIRADELSMAISEICSYLRLLDLRVGVDWALRSPVRTETALALFDFFAEFLAYGARQHTQDIFCRFHSDDAPCVVFMMPQEEWIIPWTAAWHQHKMNIVQSDLGYALSVTASCARPAEPSDAAPPKTDEEEDSWHL